MIDLPPDIQVVATVGVGKEKPMAIVGVLVDWVPGEYIVIREPDKNMNHILPLEIGVMVSYSGPSYKVPEVPEKPA